MSAFPVLTPTEAHGLKGSRFLVPVVLGGDSALLPGSPGLPGRCHTAAWAAARL